jgi:threonine aldolase
VLAAAGLLALGNVDSLTQDHANATLLADGLRDRGWDVAQPQTNIVLATVPDPLATVAELAASSIAAVTVAGKVRFVTHRDVSEADVKEALARL